MNCPNCNDTGSRSKDLEGHLDCVFCGVAEERAAVEAWAAKNRVLYGTESSLWLIYQHGKATAQNTQTEAGRAGA